MERPNGLVERERSCLLVIDVQQYFLDKLPLHERGPLV
jgi:isochorismate hydrolase